MCQGCPHARDVADLSHIELGGHTRCNVFAAGSRCEQYVAVAGGQGQHLRGHVFCQTLYKYIGLGMQYLAHTSNLRGSSGSSSSIFSGDQYMYFATTSDGRSHGI